MNNGYSICFNEWALDKDIKNELGLLLIISSLCAEKGYCFASNNYLAELFETNDVTISRKIKLLEEKGYITIEYVKRGCEIKERYIRLTKMLIHDYQNCESTINKIVKDNNISNNIDDDIINSSSNIINSNNNINIYDYLQENGFILMPIHYEKIQKWKNDDLTRYAIKKAVLNGKYNINYVDKILFNWERNNITTIEQAKAQEDEFEKAKVIKDKIVKDQKVPEWFEQDLGKGGFDDDGENF